jgi:rhodanese-related sulfurtransferase
MPRSVLAMNVTSASIAMQVPPAAPAEAAAFFSALLSFQTDVSDVRASLQSGDPGFVLVGSRGTAGWDQGHVPGAVHLPTGDIAARAAGLLDPAVPVVTYCWGPGCNGATHSALALARLGYRVKEMIGGIEYWIREGFPVETAAGAEQRALDPLTAPAGSVSCAC